MQHKRTYAVCGTLALVALCGAAWALRSHGTAAGLPDTETVYCLDPEHAQALSLAGADLGLANSATGAAVSYHGRLLAPAAWRSADPGGFDRACAAVAWPTLASSPASAGGENVWNEIGATYPVALGALLTLGIAIRQDARGARKQDVKELRDRWLDFNGTVWEYLDARSRPTGAGADLRPVSAAWQLIRDRADAMSVEHQPWKEASTLKDLLETELAPDRVADWPTGPADPAAGAARRKELAEHLATGARTVSRLAERRGRPLISLWRRRVWTSTN